MTNHEAVVEIAKQLRLRNLGGIIAIDCIDMQAPEHQEQILAVLSTELERDRASTYIVGMSAIGVIEMTRKRARASLRSALLSSCSHCRGTGRVKSAASMVSQIWNILHKMHDPGSMQRFVVEMSIEVAEMWHEVRGLPDIDVQVEKRSDFHADKFEVRVQRL